MTTSWSPVFFHVVSSPGWIFKLYLICFKIWICFCGSCYLLFHFVAVFLDSSRVVEELVVAAFTSFSPSLSPLLHYNDFDSSVSGSVAYEMLGVHSWYCMFLGQLADLPTMSNTEKNTAFVLILWYYVNKILLDSTNPHPVWKHQNKISSVYGDAAKRIQDLQLGCYEVQKCRCHLKLLRKIKMWF